MKLFLYFWQIFWTWANFAWIFFTFFVNFKNLFFIFTFLDQIHQADVFANVTQSIFVQQGIIKDSLSPKQNSSSQQESIEQIRELKSITGKISTPELFVDQSALSHTSEITISYFGIKAEPFETHLDRSHRCMSRSQLDLAFAAKSSTDLMSALHPATMNQLNRQRNKWKRSYLSFKSIENRLFESD